jgi:Secretion system C-terminal sorting domain/WD40-like Beta Propeller Repeat
MEALEPEKESRNKFTDESNDGPQLSSKKTGSLGRAFATLCIISFLAFFTQSDKQVYTPNSLISNPKRYISDLVCSHLVAQPQAPNELDAKKLAFLLYDPKKGKEHLMLSSGDKLKDITSPLFSKGFMSIQDIYLESSGDVVCAAFDTTDIRHNWEIVRVASKGEVTSLTNTSGFDEISPSMSNDQKKLAYVAGGSIYVEDAGNKIKISPHKVRAYIGVRWAPEDRLLVTVEEGMRSYIAEIDPANPYYFYRLTYSGNKVIIRNPVISPDGKNLVYVSEKGGNTEIVIADRYGSNSRILSSGDHVFYSDSATIVFIRESFFRSHLFFTNGSDVALEAIIPALTNDSKFFIRSISSYTPYTIPPSSQKEHSIKENSENKDAQLLKVYFISKGYRLFKNDHNPFNPTTTIQYEIPSSHNVKLQVLNIRGQLIRTLVNEQKAPGRYSIEFDASGLSSGVYLYRLVAGDFSQTRKMVLLK